MKLSDKQQAILDAWKNTDKNIIIKARAGCAKTTTLFEILKNSDKRTLFLAFNKSIQEEIQNKIDKLGLGLGKSLTFHSLGLQSIKKAHGNYSIKIKSGKTWDFINQMNFPKDLRGKEKLKLVYTLVNLNNLSRMFLTQDLVELQKIATNIDNGFEITDNLGVSWSSLLDLRIKEENKLASKQNIIIDFIDMIYLPIKFKLEIPIKPSYLLIDESQDMSLYQHKFIELFISQGIKRWVAVGDDNQAIYGFAGSHSNSMDLFKEKDNVIELPLNICYRCPKKIIDEANKVYDCMDYGKEEEGEVNEDVDLDDIKDDSMIICRNNKPLVDLYFYLLSKNRPVSFIGNDILEQIERTLKPYKKYGITSALTQLYEDYESIMDDGKPETRKKIFYLKEQISIIQTFVKHFSHIDGLTVDLFIENTKELLSNHNSKIKLCSIHKSKGLEADNVYILNRELIPSNFAVTNEAIKQETNLLYVAITRAKKTLNYIKI